MSCGTKLQGRFGSWAERDELADRLDRDGESRIAHAVRHGDCLDSGDLRRAERTLEHDGLMRHFDYREERCRCSWDDGEY